MVHALIVYPWDASAWERIPKCTVFYGGILGNRLWQKYVLGLVLMAACVIPSIVNASDEKFGWVSLQSNHEHHRDNKEKRADFGYKMTVQPYSIPDVTLISKDGKEVLLRDILRDDNPVLLQFIFTTCSTICPVLSATLASVQNRVTTDGRNTRLVSISIDPEHDTPKTLLAFSKRFNANENWYFLTGQRGKILQVQKAFDAYYTGNNKMYHQPYTYLRSDKSHQWVRINGFLSAKDLLREYNRLFSTAMKDLVN